MDDLLQEITMLPGVKGAFLAMSEPQLVFSDLPDGYPPETMAQIEVAMERIFKMNEPCKLTVNSVEMLFDDTMMLAKQVSEGCNLVILGEPDSNFALLNMTSTMLLGELRSQAERIRRDPPAAAPAATGDGDSRDFEVVREKDPLKSALPVLEESLARAIGPIAGMVTRETVEQWLQEGSCQKARFPELINAFCREIDDPAMEKEFRANVASLL